MHTCSHEHVLLSPCSRVPEEEGEQRMFREMGETRIHTDLYEDQKVPDLPAEMAMEQTCEGNV